MKSSGEFFSSWSIYRSMVGESEGCVELATSSVNLLFDYYVIKLLALWEIKPVREVQSAVTEPFECKSDIKLVFEVQNSWAFTLSPEQMLPEARGWCCSHVAAEPAATEEPDTVADPGRTSFNSILPQGHQFNPVPAPGTSVQPRPCPRDISSTPSLPRAHQTCGRGEETTLPVADLRNSRPRCSRQYRNAGAASGRGELYSLRSLAILSFPLALLQREFCWAWERATNEQWWNFSSREKEHIYSKSWCRLI